MLHGTSFDIEKLKAIKENGILACEFVGRPEEDETFYCADFYRVPETLKMKDYFNFCYQSEYKGILRMSKIECNRMPIRNQSGIVFIINPIETLNNLVSLDVYRDNEFTEQMKGIVNFAGIDNDRMYGSKERLSAILYGVPPNCISGVWLGDNIKDDERNIIILKELFPQSYLVDKEGTVIHEPVINKDKKSWELTEEEKTRIKNLKLNQTESKKGESKII